MDINKLKNNKLHKELTIKECEDLIKKYSIDLMKKELEYDVTLDAYNEDNKKELDKFLTKELDFKMDKDGKDILYKYEDDILGKLSIEITADGFIKIKYNEKEGEFKYIINGINNNFEPIDLFVKNITFFDDNLDNYKLEFKNLKPNTMEEWNNKLKSVKEIYNHNVREYDRLKYIDVKDKFELVIEDTSNNKKFNYKNLKDFIKDKIEAM